MVGGRVGVRDEDRRHPRRSQLPDRPAGTRDREVGRRQRLAEMVGLGEQHVAIPVDSLPQRLEVPLTTDMEDIGAAGAPGRDRHLVQRARPRERAEDGDDRPGGREIEPPPLVSVQFARLSANAGVMVARTAVCALAPMVVASAAAEMATATTFIEIVAFLF